jgi:tRNA pseudouridine38-40 synthase
VASRVEVASRTDRAVSARANALALRSELPAEVLLRRMNSICPEMFFQAASSVPPEFRVRHALRRVYRYFDPTPVADVGLREQAARLFEGRVDARSFGRGLPTERPQWRTVESVSTETVGGGCAIEVRAPSFVWGMVRKIVGALREVDQHRLTLARLEAAIAGRERLTLPLAEPDGLVLWEVEYGDLHPEAVWAGPNRHQAAFAQRALESVRIRGAVLATLFPDVDPPTWSTGRRKGAESPAPERPS